MTDSGKLDIMFDVQLFGAFIIYAVFVTTGFVIPDFSTSFMLLFAATFGSVISAGWRWKAGQIKDFATGLMSFVAGLGTGLLTAHALKDNSNAVFIVYASAIMGAKITYHMSNNFDVGKFIEGIIDRFKPKGN